MSRDYQAEYDRDQVARHGGSSGDWTSDPAEMYDPNQYDAGAAVVDRGDGNRAPEPPQYEPAPPQYAEPPNPFSDNYGAEFEQYLDARDQQSGFGAEVDYSDPYSSHEAWHAANAAQQEAQAQLNDRDAEQQFQQAFPAHIENALGNRAGSAEAAEMLAPAVREQAEHTAQELLAGLVAEGYSHQEAIDVLSQSQDALYKSSVDQVREAYGSQQALAEMRAAFRVRGAS